MGKLTDKIRNESKALSVRKYDPDYLRAMWTLLLAYGGATQNQNPKAYSYGGYYGTSIDTDKELTASILDKLQNGVEVDWSECSDPAEVIEYRFNGTFTDTQLKVKILVGTLVLSDKSSYTWGSVVPDEVSFGELIRVLGLDIQLDEALGELAERVNSRDNWSFSYSCQLPSL